MKSILLIVIIAAWIAVLVPPMLRSRVDGRPGSSVHSFQSRLNTLQKSVPHNSMPRMARPLAGAPRQQGLTRPGYSQPLNRGVAPSAQGYNMRGAQQVAARPGLERRDAVQRQQARGPQGRRTVAPSKFNAKQRRQNVLFLLILGTGLSAVLALSTKTMEMKVMLALFACSLIGYLYLLAQIRQNEVRRSYNDNWQYAD